MTHELTLPKSDTFNSTYGVITQKKKIQNSVYLTILTPHLGFIEAVLKGARTSKSKIPPLYIQPFNLIDVVLKSPTYKTPYFTIQEIDLKYSFYNEMPHYHQLYSAHLLHSLRYLFHFSDTKENYQILMMLITFLNLSSKIEEKYISEVLCLSFFIKSMVIHKLTPSVIFCQKCLKNFLKQPHLIDSLSYHPVIPGFYCEGCRKKEQNSTYYKIKTEDAQLLKIILTQPLENLFSSSLHLNELIIDNFTLISNTFFREIFKKNWEQIIHKKSNIF